jgi:hypothetical protein
LKILFSIKFGLVRLSSVGGESSTTLKLRNYGNRDLERIPSADSIFQLKTGKTKQMVNLFTFVEFADPMTGSCMSEPALDFSRWCRATITRNQLPRLPQGKITYDEKSRQ